MITIRNPSSTDKESRIHAVPGIRNLRRRVKNPRLSWIPVDEATDMCDELPIKYEAINVTKEVGQKLSVQESKGSGSRTGADPRFF